MFKPTSNPYTFKYLITSITGVGIEQVYLPPIPEDKSKILCANEKMWTKPEPSERLKKASKEFYRMLEEDEEAVHPLQHEINEYEDTEWDRCTNGVFFYNGYDDPNQEPEVVYLTGFHYWYLTHWKPYFGSPSFRDPDKEVMYWIQFWQDDPDSFGGCLNTIRRWAKSTILGAWIVYRATMNFGHNAGMQGQTDDKIKKFYKKSVLKPFYKLPAFLKPQYNQDTKQSNQIEFDLSPRRGKNYDDEVETLESMIDFRSSGEGEYDGDILHSYIIEEPGKLLKSSLYNDEGEGMWDIVKPCFTQGEEIIGKGFLGTTVENLKMNDKGGKAYKRLAYDSDYSQKQADGRTISGLYFAFLPGDCAYKGYYTVNGRPKRQEAKAALLRKRASYKNNHRKLAGEIRKYPLTIVEVFYVSPEQCQFNATILQDRLREIDACTTPFTSRIDLYWENNVRFSKVLWRHNPTGGFCDVSWIPDAKQTNLVLTKHVNGKVIYAPKDGARKLSGFDPIQHKSSSKRESKPVLYVKTKYDSTLDGIVDQEELKRRAQPGKMVNGEWILDENGAPYAYKSNKYFLRMAIRPNDPNVLYERVLMICWFLGVEVHIEKQFGGGCISYFWEWGCQEFLVNKYKPEFEKPDKTQQEGTPASTSTIEEYFGMLATYVEYFGHTIPFRELIEDLLIADPDEMTSHDDTVAAGYTELSGKVKPKYVERKIVNLDDFLNVFDNNGQLIN